MIAVNMLGKFQMSDGTAVLNDDDIHSVMMVKLLAFMLIYREKTMSVEEIAGALWQDGEIENPAGALKNLMYRLRKLLKQNFGDREYILTNQSAYGWNPQLEISLDIEEFEKLIREGKKRDGKRKEAIVCYKKAAALYHGRFMSKIAEMHWLLALNAFYHSLYLSCVKELSEIYLEEMLYDKVEALCKQALVYDKSDETLHYYLIYSRMRNNKINLAMESYEQACKILNDELGIRNSEKLMEVYEELLKMNQGIPAENMEVVQENIIEENPDGVFFCGYPVFREIYRLEARKIARLEEPEYIILFTLETPEMKGANASKVKCFKIKQGMKCLENILKDDLRIGDVASKYSDSQYIVLLTSCSYMCALKVTERISSQFYEQGNKNKNVFIKMSIEELEAASAIVK